MKTREEYIQEAELRVRKLLSQVYDNESVLMKQSIKRKNELAALEKELQELQLNRDKLETGINKLKAAGDEEWETAKLEFESVLVGLQEDKESFIHKAQEYLNDLGAHISDMEKNLEKSTESTRQKMKEYLGDLKIRKEEVDRMLNDVKSGTSESWNETKTWFAKKSELVKTYFTKSKKNDASQPHEHL